MIRAAATALAVVALLAAVPAAALASPGKQIAFGSAKGTDVPIVARAGNRAGSATDLRVRVESNRAVPVRVTVTVACARQKGSAVKTGSRTLGYIVSGPPDTRRAQPALKQADSCRISAVISFVDNAQTGNLRVTLFARRPK